MNKSSHTPPGRTEESSVIVSLNELLTIEGERVADEVAARREAEVTAKMRLEAESLARRRAEEARVAAAEEERRKQELRKRQEEAQLEGLRLAAVEKARAEAEYEVKLKVIAQTQRHEAELTAIAQDQQKKSLRRWLYAAAAGAAVLVLGSAYWVEQMGERAAREREELEGRAELLRQSIAQKETQLQQELRRIGKKDQELIERLGGQIERLEKRAQASEQGIPANERTQVTRAKGLNRGASPQPIQPLKQEVCFDGDPMCDSLE